MVPAIICSVPLLALGHNFSGEAIDMPQQHGQQASYNDNRIASSQPSLCWVILCTPTEEEGPSEISTDFVKVGEREQNESSAAAPSVWNSGSPTREGGRAKMHQLFAALASLTRGEKDGGDRD